ncbi:hypothetical protein BC937DRAFT_89371 [Endogone sp. FLAS-F59071]|nr:hypothetical protein BC937DRAFT_89371 [Endogone sp. FLAS-F59071]|eukprot:RUS17897.1 hypothetical protein BC937DRAFT_89371 [Endogone sp. FLAS-F59071]
MDDVTGLNFRGDSDGIQQKQAGAQEVFLFQHPSALYYLKIHGILLVNVTTAGWMQQWIDTRELEWEDRTDGGNNE